MSIVTQGRIHCMIVRCGNEWTIIEADGTSANVSKKEAQRLYAKLLRDGYTVQHRPDFWDNHKKGDERAYGNCKIIDPMGGN